MKARFEEVMPQTIYAYISDGGIQEEISQGSGRIAGALGLDNLIMFYDANDIQLSTETKDVTIEDTGKKIRSLGLGKSIKNQMVNDPRCHPRCTERSQS